MRRLAVFFLLVAACTSNSVTTTTIDRVPPPPSPEASSTTTTMTPTTTVPEPIRVTYEGALPDGTTYTIFMEGVPEEEVTGISGVVMFESASGPVVAGQTHINFNPVEGYDYDNGEYVIPAGGVGSFVLRFYDQVLEELGPDAESIIRSSMIGGSHLGFPRLLLQAPLRWMTLEDEVPAEIEVMYETFVVQPGCGHQAVVCNVFHGIQVIPMDRVAGPARPFEGENVFIDSLAPRPVSDPNYVDPGFIDGVGGADIFWTGEHMIVWGGRFNEVDPSNQGAMLDPESDEWRPVDGPAEIAGLSDPTRAVWLGDEMLVIAEEGVFAGDPVTDIWSRRGDRLAIRPEQAVVAIGDDVYAWIDSGIIRIGSDGQHHDLGHPGYTLQGNWRGSLLDFGGILVAWGTDCLVRRTAIWNGTGWTELETIRNRVCSLGDQVAVVDGELMTWASDADPTYLSDAGDLRWDAYDAVPFPATERPSGPLVMGDRLLVPQFEQGAIFDVANREWTVIDLPGIGSGDQMVWTGDQIIAWYFGVDAWRWIPPESG
jgi:hypothetical protein